MKFGISLPNLAAFANVRATAELAIAAEQSGWDGVFVWDHIELFGIEPCADPWVILTAIALKTERIRLGPLVTPLPRRHPAKLAREVATLDHLSGGRLILGVGAGNVKLPESSAFGEQFDARARADIVDETLEILCQWWSPGPVRYRGRYRSADLDVHGPTYQQPRVPIWLAATWPSRRPFCRAARWDGVAAQRADVMQGGIVSIEEVREINELVRGERSSPNPFEIIQFQPMGVPATAALVSQYAEAGATWWIESAAPGTDLASAEIRVRQGPPRGD